MAFDAVSSIGNFTQYAEILSGKDGVSGTIDSKDADAFEKEINKVLAKQLTTTLFSGSLLAGANEYSYIMQDAFTEVLAGQYKLVDLSNVGENYDK